MHPRGYTAKQVEGTDQQAHGGYSEEDGVSGIDRIISVLAGGDITRREEIKWGFTPEESEPYLEFWERQLLFREVVIAFMGGNNLPKSGIKADSQVKGLGWYCKGADISECRKYFGGNLENICMTCPQ